MNGNYDDILSRIPTAPLWYDEYGVPRYEPFTPRRTGNIYCNEAVLVEVVCQACLRTFTVCCSFNMPVFPSMEDHSQADLIRHNYEFLYGDPPRHSEGTYLHESAKITCVAGDSMNTLAVRVLEYWKRDRWEWVRDPSLEVTIESDERDRIEKGQW